MFGLKITEQLILIPMYLKTLHIYTGFYLLQLIFMYVLKTETYSKFKKRQNNFELNMEILAIVLFRSNFAKIEVS